MNRALLLGSVLAVGLAGCGGGDGPRLAVVQGVVKLDGQPLPQATVTFQPTAKNGSPSYAQTANDGTFTLSFNRTRKGAMLGSHLVRITTAGVRTDESGKETETPEKVPSRYNTTSGLKYEVKPSSNQFEIQLDSKPGALPPAGPPGPGGIVRTPC